MKTNTLILTLGVGCICALCTRTPAQEPADEPVVPYTPPAQSPVAAALAKYTAFNGVPAADARYYSYLESASWCGPCRAEMPHIAKAYADMRAAGVELILIGRDSTPQAAQKYLTTFKATFPGIFGQEVDQDSLPGFTAANYVPHAIIVDAQGNTIKDGHGSIALKWKEIIAEHETKQR